MNAIVSLINQTKRWFTNVLFPPVGIVSVTFRSCDWMLPSVRDSIERFLIGLLSKCKPSGFVPSKKI
ncbi:MAG: hypothetical protein ACTS46_01330 [Candidatus Hodgkinia cicadicola]